MTCERSGLGEIDASEARGEGAIDGELAIVEIVPARPARSVGPARVIGPGRIERGYAATIAALEAELAAKRRALEVAEIVERGTASLVDRIETDLSRARERARELEHVERRLVFALGALQRENELLRLSTSCTTPALAEPERPRSGWLARLFASRR